jgi:NADPH:quinone reductase-like Zn-dependent oxidoreductase
LEAIDAVRSRAIAASCADDRKGRVWRTSVWTALAGRGARLMIRMDGGTHTAEGAASLKVRGRRLAVHGHGEAAMPNDLTSFPHNASPLAQNAELHFCHSVIFNRVFIRARRSFQVSRSSQ